MSSKRGYAEKQGLPYPAHFALELVLPVGVIGEGTGFAAVAATVDEAIGDKIDDFSFSSGARRVKTWYKLVGEAVCSSTLLLLASVPACRKKTVDEISTLQK